MGMTTTTKNGNTKTSRAPLYQIVCYFFYNFFIVLMIIIYDYTMCAERGRLDDDFENTKNGNNEIKNNETKKKMNRLRNQVTCNIHRVSSE